MLSFGDILRFMRGEYLLDYVSFIGVSSEKWNEEKIASFLTSLVELQKSSC